MKCNVCMFSFDFSHKILTSFNGQYLHLPNLVQILGFVSTCLNLGNLLKPINGFCVKICFNSSQCSIFIFQFEKMIFFSFFDI